MRARRILIYSQNRRHPPRGQIQAPMDCKKVSLSRRLNMGLYSLCQSGTIAIFFKYLPRIVSSTGGGNYPRPRSTVFTGVEALRAAMISVRCFTL